MQSLMVTVIMVTDLRYSNKNLAESVRLMLARRGLFSTIYSRERSSRLPSGKQFPAQTYNVVWSDPKRRHNWVKTQNGDFLVPLRGVSKEPFEGRVFNLHVANDNRLYCKWCRGA